MTMSDLSQTLDIILEEESPPEYNATASANEIAKQLEIAQRKVIELQNKLSIAHNKMCAELALDVRRKMPGLNVSVDRGNCKIGYRMKHLVLRPDSRSGIWKIKSSDDRFAKRFMKYYGTNTAISPSLDSLVDAIITYFKEHYKSLGEDIIGTGVILIEGRKSSITNLVVWHESQTTKRRLNSRLSRVIK